MESEAPTPREKVHLLASILDAGQVRQATEAELEREDFPGMWSVYVGEHPSRDTWLADFADRKDAGDFATAQCRKYDAVLIEDGPAQ